MMKSDFSTRAAGPVRTGLLVLLLASCLQPARLGAVDTVSVRERFLNPPREYSSGPLWVWNDRLSEDQIRRTLRDLAGQGVRQVWVHPRPGLMTPYLSEEWFRLWKLALAEAERLDMNVWIYDENSYPSGFAGGWVPELMPESRGRGLHFEETTQPPGWNDDLLGVYRISDHQDVTAELKEGVPLPEGPRYLIASVRRASDSPWHGGKSYVDLLYPGVTEKFIEVTLEAYRREVGDEFGKRIPGSFTDEPELRPAGGLPWTEDLPERFQERWGYDLTENLASLKLRVGDWKRVRHNYYQTLNDLFIERWAKPYYAYCAQHDLEFTGHYWEHDWPNCTNVPDNMAMYAWMQRPGIDCLMNQYAEHTHAQFGNLRAVKELSSVANQLGKSRTLCEIYGAGGWDLRFEDMKRIADWLAVLGVNTFNEHLSYVTLRGARKRDHPQSFSYHEPWWSSYHVIANYLARLSVAMSAGQQVNRILVIEPTTTAWMYQGEGEELKQIGDAFFDLLRALETAGIEYDLGCEDILALHGSVNGQQLHVGRRAYDTVVLPPHWETLNRSTFLLLHQFVLGQGRILDCHSRGQRLLEGLTPAIPGLGADVAAAVLARAHPRWEPVRVEDVPGLLAELAREAGFRIERRGGDAGKLFHHRRRLADGELLLLVNTSMEVPSAGLVSSRASSVERWDLFAGTTEPHAFAPTSAGVQVEFELPPSGSLLLFLSDESAEPPRSREITRVLETGGRMEVRRLEPNVLTLDYVDITAGGETRKNLYFYDANRFAFQRNGLDRNPWDSAVQFKDELIARTFPEESGFVASYHFTISTALPGNLAIVVERPDLYEVSCNGVRVRARRGDWWLDRAFGRIDIAKCARVGGNTLTLKATPFTLRHEVEPAYVLGDFLVRPAESGFVLVPDEPIEFELPEADSTPEAGDDSTAELGVRRGWNRRGLPFYGGNVIYEMLFNVPGKRGNYFVVAPSWYGSVARVRINGDLVGIIMASPWECEVTEEIIEGPNRVSLEVFGTLKNTLGPHHGNPPPGSAWPGMFQRGPNPGPPPGAEYSTIDYGLFEPFKLERRFPSPPKEE